MTDSYRQLIITTLRDPKGGAKQTQQFILPLTELFMLASLVCLVGSIFTSLQIQLFPTDDPSTFVLGRISPFSVTIYSFLSFAILILGTFLVGKLFRGQGSLIATLFNLTLIQTIMVGVQLLNIVVGIILPASIANWVGIAGFAYFIFLFCIFVAELHKFRSPLMVFLGSIGFFLILILVLGSIVIWLMSSV